MCISAWGEEADSQCCLHVIAVWLLQQGFHGHSNTHAHTHTQASTAKTDLFETKLTFSFFVLFFLSFFFSIILKATFRKLPHERDTLAGGEQQCRLSSEQIHRFKPFCCYYLQCDSRISEKKNNLKNSRIKSKKNPLSCPLATLHKCCSWRVRLRTRSECACLIFFGWAASPLLNHRTQTENNNSALFFSQKFWLFFTSDFRSDRKQTMASSNRWGLWLTNNFHCCLAEKKRIPFAFFVTL